MTRLLEVENYTISTPVYDIIQRLQMVLTNGKLRDVRKNGDNIVVTCPKHSGGHESHPACNVYVGADTKIEYGYFNCFACGARGNFLTFVAECFDCSKEFAKDWLVKNFPAQIRASIYSLGPDIQIKEHRPAVPKTFLDPASLDSYLTWHSYLGQRKLSRETCERFNIRYDPKNRRIIFPAYDSLGRLVMLPWRSIDTKTFYLDYEAEKPVYCLQEVIKKKCKAALITEGPFDCLTGWEYGFPTVATFGQPSPNQYKQLKQSGLNILYTAFDNDFSGQKFTKQLKQALGNCMIIIELQFPPGKKDLNDLSREQLEEMIKKASNSLF
jgi:DNA primase